MKPGRPPKPTVLKLIQGNPGRRPIKKGEVNPKVRIPECPEHLIDEARAEWVRITPLLFSYRLITDIDTVALALYCQAYGRLQQAEKKIAEMRAKSGDGLLIKSQSGYPIQNPYLSIANKASNDCYRYLQQFGLSPSARTRVDKADEGDDEENHSYLT